MRRAAIALLALAASGCAGYGPGAPSDAGSAVTAFLNACAQDRSASALELLTPLARRAFLAQGADGCVTFLGLARPGGSPDARAALLRRTRVVAVDSGGAAMSATVTIRGPDGRTHEVEAEGRGSLWQIAGVSGG